MYGDLATKWIGPVLGINPLIGLGYEVPPLPSINISQIDPIFLETQADIFLIQIFKMLGLVGIGLMMLIFVLSPVRCLLRHQTSVFQKSISLGILGIAATFSHYNPLSSPPVAIVVCWLLVEHSLNFDSESKDKETA
jgi:hypothetical protein